MNKILTLGTLLLGCCLAVFAQTGTAPNQEAPQGAAPSTYPQDQGMQPPANQAVPAAPTAVMPDANAPGGAQEQAAAPAKKSAPQIATVQGCLSESAGAFMLADDLGNNYQLAGDTSQLAGLTGKEVQVTGRTISNGGTEPGSMSSAGADSSASAGAVTQFSVSQARKIADVCSAASATGK